MKKVFLSGVLCCIFVMTGYTYSRQDCDNAQSRCREYNSQCNTCKLTRRIHFGRQVVNRDFDDMNIPFWEEHREECMSICSRANMACSEANSICR
jgi:hypothetical protein